MTMNHLNSNLTTDDQQVVQLYRVCQQLHPQLKLNEIQIEVKRRFICQYKIQGMVLIMVVVLKYTYRKLKPKVYWIFFYFKLTFLCGLFG